MKEACMDKFGNCFCLKLVVSVPLPQKGRFQWGEVWPRVFEPLKVEVFYGYMCKEPGKNDLYRDAWDLKRLWGYAARRQKDSYKRRQSPRDPSPNHAQSFWFYVSFSGQTLISRNLDG